MRSSARLTSVESSTLSPVEPPEELNVQPFHHLDADRPNANLCEALPANFLEHRRTTHAVTVLRTLGRLSDS
jgi:hypothetical protein